MNEEEPLRLGRERGPRPTGRVGLITGNLSFPSETLSRLAEVVWLDAVSARDRSSAWPDARNRFMSGLPAQP